MTEQKSIEGSLKVGFVWNQYKKVWSEVLLSLKIFFFRCAINKNKDHYAHAPRSLFKLKIYLVLNKKICSSFINCPSSAFKGTSIATLTTCEIKQSQQKQERVLLRFYCIQLEIKTDIFAVFRGFFGQFQRSSLISISN